MNATSSAMLANYDMLSTARSIPQNNKTYGNGSATFDLPHAGIPTHVTVSFNGTLSATNGTTAGTLTASPMWPFAIMAPSSYLDYSGNTRIFADGYSLYLRELLLGTGLSPKTPYDSESYSANIYAATLPAMTAATTTTAPVVFSVTFPVSLKSTTALGSYDATVPKGTAQLIVNEAGLTGPYINSPLTITGTGASVKLTGTWSAEYYYLDAPSSVPKPVSALAEIHEFYQANTPTDQIVAGGTPSQILLTGRTYYRVMQRLIADNAMNTMDIANVQFLVDSSTPTLNETLAAYLFNIRRKFNRDMPVGTILWDFMAKPWSPNSYGSLTTQLTLNNSISAGAYAQLTTVRETLYSPTGNLISAGG